MNISSTRVFALLLFSLFPFLGGQQALADFSSTDYTFTTKDEVAWVPTTDLTPLLTAGDPAQKVDIILPFPAILYGHEGTLISMSRNGYIDWSTSDDGSDQAVSCPLPTVPSNNGSGCRIFALHGKHLASSNLYYEYRPAGVHPDNRWGAHVFTWENASLNGQAGSIDFQVLVFDDFEIIKQYRPNGSFGAGVAVGIQESGTSSDFLSVVCEQADTIKGDYSIRYQPPTVDANDLTGTSFNGTLTTVFSGTRICFSFTGNPVITRNQDTTLTESVALVGPPGGMTLLGANTINIANKKHLAILGIDTLDYGASAIVTNGPLRLQDCDFRDSFQVNPDGAIRSTGRVACDQCHFFQNSSEDSDGGGAITAPEIRATDCHFEECSATGAAIAAKGGAVRIDESTTSTFGASTLTRCLFESNSTTGAGGALWVSGGAGVDLIDCQFIGNSVTENLINFSHGGAVSLFDTICTTQRCTFIENNGSLSGGAFFQSGNSFLTLRNSVLDSNEAEEFGAIAHLGSALNLEFCSIFRTLTTASATSVDIGGDINASISSDSCLYVSTEREFFDNAHTNFTSVQRNVVNEQLSYPNFQDPTTPPAPFDATLDVARINHFISDKRGGAVSEAFDTSSITDDEAAGSTTDVRGAPRRNGTRVDIGAYEFIPSMTVNSLNDDPTFGGTVSLREAWILSDDLIILDPALDGETIILTSPLPPRTQITEVVFAGAGNNGFIPEITIDGSASGSISLVGHTDDVPFSSTPQFFFTDIHFTGFPDAVFTPSEEGQIILSRSRFTNNGQVIFADTNFGPIFLSSSDIRDNGSAPVFTPLLQARDIELTSCLLEGNRAPIYRPRISNGESSSLSVSNCSVVRNQGSFADIPFQGATPSELSLRFEDSTFSTNNIDGDALIDSTLEASIEVTQCTFANHGRATGGPALFELADNSQLTLANSIFENNNELVTAPNSTPAEMIVSNGYNLLDEAPTATWNNNDLLNRKAHLAPLGFYSQLEAHARFPVHALLAISPAIDMRPEEVNDPAGQFGDFQQDGDGDGFIRGDIGAYEAPAIITVTNENNSGAGSLRQAILDSSGWNRIVFAPQVNTITLSSDLNIDENLQIDATDRAQGVTISGGNTTRIFDFQGGSRSGLFALNLTEGAGDTNFSSAIRIRDGWITAAYCSVTNCSAGRGTAAYVEVGGLTLQNCTLARNTALSNGTLDFLAGTINRIEHCTIAENYSAEFGAIRPREGCLVYLHHNWLTNNFRGDASAPGIEDNFYVGNNSTLPLRLISEGYNLTPDTDSGLIAALNQTGDNTGQAGASFAPNFFQEEEGWSQNLLALTGYPENLDSNPPLFPHFDQRGWVRRIGDLDIGAIELGADTQDSDSDGLPDYWEVLYGFDPINTDDSLGNSDGDSFTNADEFARGSNPLVFDESFIRILNTGILPNTAPPTFFMVIEGAAGESYNLFTSPDLENWSLDQVVNTTGALMTLQFVIGTDPQFFQFERVGTSTEN